MSAAKWSSLLRACRRGCSALRNAWSSESRTEATDLADTDQVVRNRAVERFADGVFLFDVTPQQGDFFAHPLEEQQCIHGVGVGLEEGRWKIRLHGVFGE